METQQDIDEIFGWESQPQDEKRNVSVEMRQKETLDSKFQELNKQNEEKRRIIERLKRRKKEYYLNTVERQKRLALRKEQKRQQQTILKKSGRSAPPEAGMRTSGQKVERKELLKVLLRKKTR
ncbi:MAG: hypothetical protein IJ184_00820 [Alphaproteobacteria bacterium]|nr:hypothetical protein [Alphaproteobacteria bacterium]